MSGLISPADCQSHSQSCAAAPGTDPACQTLGVTHTYAESNIFFVIYTKNASKNEESCLYIRQSKLPPGYSVLSGPISNILNVHNHSHLSKLYKSLADGVF